MIVFSVKLNDDYSLVMYRQNEGVCFEVHSEHTGIVAHVVEPSEQFDQMAAMLIRKDDKLAKPRRGRPPKKA